MIDAPSDRALLRAVLRSDLTSFVRRCFNTLAPGQRYVANWSLEAIAHQLERVQRGEVRRLIINLPPRSLKSITASVAFPAFVLGHDPTMRILCVSYAGDLAVKQSNDFRAVLASPWYRELFPGSGIGRTKNSEVEIELEARGSRLATSVGGTLTGRGGNLIIIDDPLKPTDALSEPKRSAANQWCTNTLLSRLDDPSTGAIVIVMQRVHMDDLVGHVQTLSDGWTVLSLPEIADHDETIPLPRGRVHHRRQGEVLEPERFTLDQLQALRRQLGTDLFSAQYQQAPVPPGGAMVKRAWIRRYSALPTDPTSRMILQSWDTASKGGPDNDWSVCTTWEVHGELYYLIDVYRNRIDYPTLKSQVVALAARFDAQEVLVEEVGTAMGLLDELRPRVRGLIGVRPDKDKQTRMSIASAKFEAGQVYLPEGSAWLPEFEAELFAFPGSRHDDQVDSVSQALNNENTTWIYERLAENIPIFMQQLGLQPW